MSHFDVFNGDADGLCALHQLRLAQPREGQLITGVKRDNALLKRVTAKAGDSVTVLDIALSRNHSAVLDLLEAGVEIEYFDHHHAGDIPQHPNLHAVIDPSADTCTAVLVDRHLGGRYRPWAVVGAFGDNQRETAARLASDLRLDEPRTQALRRLGECLNYNSYGDSEEDLLYRPAELYLRLRPYADPFEFLANEDVYSHLERERSRDMECALAVHADADSETAAVYRLPDSGWARRVVGTLANRLRSANDRKAFAVLVPNSRRNLTVSLRVPGGFSPGADVFARRYGGDGRHAAAGITDLPLHEVARFTQDFLRFFAAAGGSAVR